MKYETSFLVEPVGNTPHAKASRRAIVAYASAIYDECPELADELWQWIEKVHEDDR
jgi:hypothetical protein